MGDNQTGVGSGDDENIIIKLHKANLAVESIWIVITIYTRGNQFDDVSGAYARISDNLKGNEFCKFNLSNNRDGVSNGCIMANIRRYGEDEWTITTRGYYTENTHMYKDMTSIIKKVKNNDFSQVKILKDRHDAGGPSGGGDCCCTIF
jgi:stress response protein SCP2